MGSIIWLASYPKSGNTWLRAFLANYLRNAPEPVDINELARIAPNEASRAYFERAQGGPLAGLSEAEIHGLRPKVHRLLAGAVERTGFLKTHLALTRLGGVATVTPEVTAGAIYILRNPLDVAESFMAFFGALADEVVAALNYDRTCLPGSGDQVVQHLGTWSAHVTGWTTAQGLRRLVLRYEDLLDEPEAAFARVTAFLGLPQDAERLRRAIRFSRFETLAGQEQAHGFVERPVQGQGQGQAQDRGQGQGQDRGAAFFRKGRAGGYRGALSQDQIASLLEAHREVMREFGYLTPDGRPSY